MSKEVDFISVQDVEIKYGAKGVFLEGESRNVSIYYNERTNTIKLLGGLNHGAELRLDKENAQKLIDVLTKWTKE